MFLFYDHDRIGQMVMQALPAFTEDQKNVSQREGRYEIRKELWHGTSEYQTNQGRLFTVRTDDLDPKNSLTDCLTITRQQETVAESESNDNGDNGDRHRNVIQIGRYHRNEQRTRQEVGGNHQSAGPQNEEAVREFGDQSSST